MIDRDACERRAYRLAVLLTGDPRTARKVLREILAAQSDLRLLDSSRLDRLTVLRCREVRSRPIEFANIPRSARRALARLPAQQREAYVLRHVYQADPRAASRAMDCSLAAANRHLELAERTLLDSLGGEWRAAAQSLLQYSLQIDAPKLPRRRFQIKRHGRLLVSIVLILLVFAAIAVIVLRVRLWRGGA